MAPPKIRTDWRMVGVAFLAGAASTFLQLGPNLLTLAVSLAGAALSTFFFWLLARPAGRFLARVVWRRSGSIVQRRVLSFAARRVGARRILLTSRPEPRARERVRVLETAALVVGVNALGVTLIRAFLPLGFTLGLGLALLGAGFALTVLLTPQWAFARLGMRRVRPKSLVITPLSREYGSVTRVADGAFLLVAVSISTFVLRHLGNTDWQAFKDVISIIANAAGFVILVASFAIRHHARTTSEEDEALVAHAKALGCVDLRGASDDELAGAIVRAA